jgi:hypothetical protein
MGIVIIGGGFFKGAKPFGFHFDTSGSATRDAFLAKWVALWRKRMSDALLRGERAKQGSRGPLCSREGP